MTTVKPKILIIDDNMRTISQLRPYLREKFEIFTASNGPDGLKLARESHPDIVLLDIRMPQMDGLEVLRRLKADRDINQIVVMMYTALGDKDITLQAIQSGALDYVVRSTDIDLLLAKLDQIVTQIILPKRSQDFVVSSSSPAKATTPNMTRVFISYASENRSFADFLKKKADEWGFHGWIDHDSIKASQSWLLSIEEALHTCHGMIVALSPEAVASHFVTSEYLAILRMNKPLFPVLYSPCKIPMVLEPIHYINYYANPDKALEELRESLKGRLG